MPMTGTRQFINWSSMVRDLVVVVLMVVLCLSGVGCGSIYHETQAKLPPEPFAQLTFRIKEAQQAEQLAGQSITRLRDQLKQNGTSAETFAGDIDRLMAAAFEFERRVASVLDAAAHCEGKTQLASEIERLQGRSAELQEYVQALRRDGNSLNARQLDDLLHGSAKL